MSMAPFIEAIKRADDVEAFDALVEQCIAYDTCCTLEDVHALWEACWATWNDHDTDQRLILGELMAAMKASYPTLPGKPSWAILGDPEES